MIIYGVPRLCQNPTFHEDMILAGYLGKWMWTFTKATVNEIHVSGQEITL